jgi:hypothetical protein
MIVHQQCGAIRQANVVLLESGLFEELVLQSEYFLEEYMEDILFFWEKLWRGKNG